MVFAETNCFWIFLGSGTGGGKEKSIEKEDTLIIPVQVSGEVSKVIKACVITVRVFVVVRASVLRSLSFLNHLSLYQEITVCCPPQHFLVCVCFGPLSVFMPVCNAEMGCGFPDCVRLWRWMAVGGGGM